MENITRNVKILGGGTTVLNITRYKTRGKYYVEKNCVVYVLQLKKKKVRIKGKQCISPYL